MRVVVYNTIYFDKLFDCFKIQNIELFLKSKEYMHFKERQTHKAPLYKYNLTNKVLHNV